MNVLLTRRNIKKKCVSIFQYAKAICDRTETNKIEQADVVGFRHALLHEFINL